MDPSVVSSMRALDSRDDLRAVVLVEGSSDRVALEALATRRGRDLESEGVAVLAMGGATSIGRFLDLLGDRRSALQLAGLCDAGERPAFRRALERAGFGAALSDTDMEALGFHACVEDLEDELIRALGAPRVEELLDAEGELRSFRILQQQPAQQGRPAQRQLRRFMGTRSGRKAHFARVLVEALADDRVPRPLERVLADVGAGGARRPATDARRQ
jgi:hypothetical protein